MEQGACDIMSYVCTHLSIKYPLQTFCYSRAKIKNTNKTEIQADRLEKQELLLQELLVRVENLGQKVNNKTIEGTNQSHSNDV